jgi:hypothetical protein
MNGFQDLIHVSWLMTPREHHEEGFRGLASVRKVQVEGSLVHAGAHSSDTLLLYNSGVFPLREYCFSYLMFLFI